MNDHWPATPPPREPGWPPPQPAMPPPGTVGAGATGDNRCRWHIRAYHTTPT